MADLRHCDALGSRGPAGGPGSGTGRIWTLALPVRWSGGQNVCATAKSLLHYSELSRGHPWPAGGAGTDPFTTYSKNGHRRRGTHDPGTWVRDM